MDKCKACGAVVEVIEIIVHFNGGMYLEPLCETCLDVHERMIEKEVNG